VVIRVHLDQTRVVAGQTIRGQAVVTNTTAKPILLRTCAKSGWLMVGLTNGKIPFDPAFAAVGCAPSVWLAPGQRRYSITVMTTYQACLQPGGHSVYPVPTCSPNGLPPLPAGTYRTKVVAEGLPETTEAAPVTVTLLPSGSR